MNKLLLTFFILLITGISWSQYQTFTPDSSKYFKEAEAYLAYVNKTDAKEFMKEFELMWFGGKFTEDQRTQVYKASNLMSVKKLKPYPDFKNYLSSVMNFVGSGKTIEDFNVWHETVNSVLSGKNKKRTSKYLETCKNLFASNIIFKSSSTTWQSSNNNYHFIFEKEPIIVFDETTLKCYSKNDSSVLHKTKGTYHPMTSIWEGEGGKLTWERADLPKEEVYAHVSTYKISMKSAGFSADSVLFHSHYFEQPLLGRLSEKVLSNRGSAKVAYPSFESYDKRLEIKSVFKDVDYEGGFTIKGRNLLGTGTHEELARIIFHYNGSKFFVAESIVFTINAAEITADKANIKIIIDTDSITHPGLSFSYKNNNEKVTLIRGVNQGVSQSPYYNSYHKLDMYFEALTWKVGDPVLEFGALHGSTDTVARFESYNYFDKNIYDSFIGMGNNPLVMIKIHANKMESDNLEVAGLATSMRKTIQGIEPLLFHLTTLGFISYDNEKKMVYVKEKMYHYIDARKGKRDYDAIMIQSDAKHNGSLNLKTNDLLLRGISKTTLSAAQYVKIFPMERRMIIQKNRNIQFGGIINVGRTEYFGNQFLFDYEGFRIDLLECDSMRLRVLNERPGGGRPIRLFSTIEGIRGDIRIDDVENKSGLDTSKHEYPILNCTKNTYVFYDKFHTQRGAYNRREFKFIIEPFVMDSLDNYSNQGVLFDGKFISAGIFPDFQETLSIQDDYSLGFARDAPKDGFGIYGNKATYDNQIQLSNKGLKGAGEVSFLTSHAISDDITFLPQKVKAVAQTYINDGQKDNPNVPLVKGENIKVTYIPKDKVFFAESVNELMDFFGGKEAQLEGKLSLNPDGMTGEGRMYFGKGRMLSYSYNYGYTTIDADTSEFKLLTDDLESTAFKTGNVNAHVDFETRIGEFKSNTGTSFVEFPENQYICFMDMFKWKMETDDIDLENRKQNVTIDSDLDLASSNFFSTHPDQDSLDFRSPKAKFDIKNKKLTCREIEYITIADARIYPDTGVIVIRKKAKIETLKDAKIIANSITKYHEIFDAEVDIFAKRSYKADGYYNYVDEAKMSHKIHFTNIHPDSTFQTIGSGEIDDKSGFQLSPQFEFNGKVAMYSAFKELTFTGETRISHNCSGLKRNWMSFTASIDPEDIFIPVGKELTDTKGNPIGAGIVLNPDSIALYSTFLSRKNNKTHIDVMTADGFLHYDKKSKEYQISNMDKLKESFLPGNYVSLNPASCKLKGDGQFSFGTNLGQVEVIPVGETKYDPKTNKLDIKSSVSINFPFNNDALDKMAKHIIEYPDLISVDVGSTTYEKTLRERIGLEKADKIISDLNIHGKVKKLPDELNSSIYLADIRFKWDPKRNAYVSFGDIGIANFNKKQIFKYTRGKIVIYKGKAGDKISIFLQLDENNFYYFTYSRGLMAAYSTNEEFNTIILETNKDKTKFKGNKDVEDFQYMLSSKTKAVGFRRSFD